MFFGDACQPEVRPFAFFYASALPNFYLYFYLYSYREDLPDNLSKTTALTDSEIKLTRSAKTLT